MEKELINNSQSNIYPFHMPGHKRRGSDIGAGITIPPTRTFEPPKTVYKKCLLGVIVEAEIPKSAHVRGGKYFKCRASEAIITGIIGDTLGEKIGISDYDYKTTYQVGDHVVIDNFDSSDNECSTGFHFFCLKQEAELYQV